MKRLLPRLDNRSLDELAVTDLLMLHFVCGKKTLVEQVSALPPASVLVYDDGEISIERYLQFDYGSAPTGDYLQQLAHSCRLAVGNIEDGMTDSLEFGFLVASTVARSLRL